MNDFDKIEDIVVTLDKFSKSSKDMWDYKILCDSLSSALYYGMNKSMYESFDTFDISELNIIQNKLRSFVSDEIPHHYGPNIPNVTIFNPTNIQKLYSEYNIKRDDRRDNAFCDIYRQVNMILSYMLAIYLSKGGDMIL